MDSVDYEVYSGMYLHHITFSNDIMIIIVLILLLAFAWIFRLNFPLFGKMISNISADEKRQSIFETTEKDSFLFTAFMTFQTLLLLSVFLFVCAVKYKLLLYVNIETTLLYVGILLVLFFIFFFFKQILQFLFGAVFVEKTTNDMMITNFQSLFCVWGITLYVPVLWILLFDTHLYIPIIILIISYLAYSVILSLRIINIFFNKNTGLLFLSLYLCAQEIVPLVFLYEGLVYIYNVIEKNNTWQ